ncbi:MAG: hypothetical protein AB7O26_19905 [Planctomycetaceae bacterium]
MRFDRYLAGVLIFLAMSNVAPAADRQAPPGMFRDLDDDIVGDAIIIEGKQLFIDDHIVGELKGARKVLNQPVKHPSNPLITRDRPSDGETITYGSVLQDPADGLFKLWYQIYYGEGKKPNSVIGYATSRDGVKWEKPSINKGTNDNLITFEPAEPWVVGAGVMLDPVEKDPARRFKMLYSAMPDGKSSSLSTCAAYSADGIHWKQEPKNPLIPFSDTQACPFWDEKTKQYVAYLRFGPPNVRIISRIQSSDFVHWSPKVTVLKTGPMDAPFNTQFYLMPVTPYEGISIGLICAYHSETIQPIPKDKLWMDRKNLQLAFSRNGLTWNRVAKAGAIPAGEMKQERDWKTIVEEGAFVPNGPKREDWDWGVLHPVQAPLVVGDEIRIYYQGNSGRNWWNYHKDPNKDGYGLATLRLDGFVSVEAEAEGTFTTKPIVFIGDTLVINANAAGGSLKVEALDADGKPIEGFAAADCDPISSDDVRHVVKWKKNADCHLLQARPIRLRFHLHKAKLYAFEPQIRNSHYLQAYD